MAYPSNGTATRSRFGSLISCSSDEEEEEGVNALPAMANCRDSTVCGSLEPALRFRYSRRWGNKRAPTDVLDVDVSSESEEPTDASESDDELLDCGRLTRRGGVSAEATGAFNVNYVEWVRPQFDKTREQRGLLKESFSKFPFSRHLEDDDLEALADACEIDSCKASEAIYRKGEVGRSCVILLSGEAVAYIDDGARCSSASKDPGSPPKKIRNVRIGEILGEHTMLWGFKRHQTIIAETECIFGKMKRATFFNITVRSGTQRRNLYQRYLRKVPMFETFSEELIASLADIVSVRSYAAKDHIVVQGAKGNEFFIVLTGECVANMEVERVGSPSVSQSGSHDVHELRRYESGERFGELAFLNRTRRAATITACTDVTLLSLKRRTYERVLGSLDLRQKEHYASDPRKAIADFYGSGDANGPLGVSSTNGSPIYRTLSDIQTDWFAVYRPTSRDALAKILNMTAVGKGLNVKGKSAKMNRLSGFVPFIQISDNSHKSKIEASPPDARLQVFYQSDDERELALIALEAVMQTLLQADKDGLLQPTEKVDSYTGVFGLDMPELAMREAYIMQADISHRVGWETGRHSEPAYMDANLQAARGGSKPTVVLYQFDQTDPMNPNGLLIAYAEGSRVKPVVSDFDTFLVGSRGMRYDSLPPDQVTLLRWLLEQTRKILSNPGRALWNSRWIEVLKESKKKGLRMNVPEYGFGDPTSYRLTEEVIKATNVSGAVRHGAECFNLQAPQELDEEFLVIWDGFEGKPWQYILPDQLREFLLQRIRDGYSFPLNPVWPLRDKGWYEIFAALKESNADQCFEAWYPADSGAVAEIEALHKEFPEGFSVLPPE